MKPYRLDVLVPSRGRPGSILRLWRAIADTAEHPEWIRLRVRVDDDDPRRFGYGTRDTFDAESAGRLILTRGPRIRLASSWNEQAREAVDDRATHLALWGDDNIPITPGWDARFVERLEQDGPGWVYGCDGVWDNRRWPEHPEHLILPTATVMSAGLYQVLGWASPPGLVHLCIDVAWRDLGIEAGCLFFEPDVTIRHFHRCVGAPNDQTYRDANDNPEQFRNDNLVVQRWKLSKDFQLDAQNIREYREFTKALRG